MNIFVASMKNERQILSSSQLEITIKRLCQQLIESHSDFSETVLISLQPRGKHLLNNILAILSKEFNCKNISSGDLDISFIEMI